MGRPIWQDNIWDTGDDRTEEGASLTWADISNLFAKSRLDLGRSQGYINDCSSVLKKTAEWAAEQSPAVSPQRFGVSAAKRRLAVIKAEGRSDRTAQAASIQLKTVFKWLYQEGYFPKDNLDRLKNPAIVTEVRPRLAITFDEFNRMIAANRRLWSSERNPGSRFKSETLRRFHVLRNEVMITMLIDGAMRVSEICAVPLQCVDVVNGLVALPAVVTKTKQARVVALSSRFARGVLSDWIAFRSRIMADHSDDPGTLFISERREIVNPDYWARRFNRIVQEARLERHITTHCCRRAGSSTMDLADREVSKLQTGHVNDSVHDLYHVVGDAQIARLREAKDKVGMFGEPYEVSGKPASVARRGGSRNI